MATCDILPAEVRPLFIDDISKLQAGIDTTQDSSALSETDDFRIYCYKILPCSKRAAHEWTTCPWAHPGEKARRRDPRMYSYLAIPCQETKEGKECPRGDDCPNCHSLFEYWLHPSRYRTQLCRNNDGNHCKRQICFFAHSIEELRVPDHSHLKIPEEIKQASAKKDNSTDTVSDTDTAADATSGPSAHPGSPRADAGNSPKSATATAAALQPRKDRRHSKGSLTKAASAKLPVSAASALDATGSPTTPSPSSAATVPPNGSSMAALLAGQYPLGIPQCFGPAADSNTALLRAQQQQQLAALQATGYAGPTSAAAAARRAASLDIGRLPSDASITTPGRFSLDTIARNGQTFFGANGLWASSSLFSNAMVADPEVPDPSNSPQSAARRASLLLQQQQMQQLLQSGRQEHQLDPAAVEQQLQVLVAQQQQLAQLAAANAGSRRGSYMDYTAAGGSRRGSYVDYSMNGSRRGSYVDYGSTAGSRRGSWVDYNAASRRGSYVDYAATAASRRGSYVDYVSGAGSPPLSPATSSMLGPGSSGLPDECQSVSSVASLYMGVPAAGWPPAPLHRAISGPAAFSQPLPAIPCGAPRYNSEPAATGATPATAIDLAAIRAHMELLGPQAMAAAAAAGTAGFTAGFCAEQLPVAAQTIPECLPVTAQVIPEQPETAEELNLQNVAELVNSVNRGELGTRGNEVLTGVIGLLMQQLQHQQPTARVL